MRAIIRKLGGLALGLALLLGALASTAGARTHWRVYHYYGPRRPVYYHYYYPQRYVYHYPRSYYWSWHHHYWRHHRDWD